MVPFGMYFHAAAVHDDPLDKLDRAVGSHAMSLYTDAFGLLVQRHFSRSHDAFVRLFHILKGSEDPMAVLLATEALVKIAECKLATSQFSSCIGLSTCLLHRPSTHDRPLLLHRLYLIRGLALSGQNRFIEAQRDLLECLQRCPDDKRVALLCLMRRVTDRQRQYLISLQQQEDSATAAASLSYASHFSEEDTASSCSTGTATPHYLTHKRAASPVSSGSKRQKPCSSSS